MLPSVDTLTSIAAHKRIIVCVRLKIGSVDALLQQDHSKSIFVPLGDVDEKHDTEMSARLAFLYGWLSGLLIGLCVTARSPEIHRSWRNSYVY
jgi:hypothetical protein